MIKLSCVIITFNEERNIGKCLESVKKVADEVVVIDSCSTDKTVEICKSYGARVIDHPFEGYIEQKNYALNHASNQYVLSLDADEALSDTLINSILLVKENWKCDGYTMNRLNNYCGKWIYHSGWYPDRKMRLFNKTKGSWKGVNPHDVFTLESGTTQEFLKGNLEHFSFSTVEEHISREKQFANIAASALFKNGKKSGFIHVYMSPIFKFIRNYFLKLGFLDGYYGWVISSISAKGTYWKYSKLKELQNNSLK